MKAKTLYDKLWDEHVVLKQDDGTSLIYIDRHLVHEVTSPQAFEGLRSNNRNLFRSKSIFATVDHNNPTDSLNLSINDPISKLQIDTLDENIKYFQIKNYFPLKSKHQGIVHVIGPELGATLPGMSVVCGDSHTSTHGALATLAQGIGTSEVEHVMATQCINAKKSKNMLIKVNGKLNKGVAAKDLALYLIGNIGTAGGTGYAIEFAGSAISDLSIEGRMTLCNMAIEAGARFGLVAFDNKTLEFIKNKPYAPNGKLWDLAVKYWESTLFSDPKAMFDKTYEFDAKIIKPQVTWGTSPEMVISIDDNIPNPDNENNLIKRNDMSRALTYMGLKSDIPIQDINIDVVFIGSCTNSRIEDLKEVANIVKGKHKSDKVNRVLVVPGSQIVKKQAEDEGLDKIFIDAGFEWRNPGCSMCLGMNDDRLNPQERCASTSNRNFEGRQGLGGRTHLVSPAMAAAAAIYGHFVDIRNLN